MHKVINVKSNSITHLNNIYNKEFVYSTNYKNKFSGNNLIVEEFEELEIDTDIKDKNDLDNFIIELRKTDVKKFFKSIVLKVKYNDFFNCPNNIYITLAIISDKEKEFVIVINTEKL